MGRVAAAAIALCALCKEPAEGKLPERHNWSWVRGQTRVLYARKDGQWLSTPAKICAECWDALAKRPVPGFCYTCFKKGTRGPKGRDVTDAAAHQKENPGHYVRRGRL